MTWLTNWTDCILHKIILHRMFPQLFQMIKVHPKIQVYQTFGFVQNVVSQVLLELCFVENAVSKINIDSGGSSGAVQKEWAALIIFKDK